MPFFEKDSMRYFYFERLSSSGMEHGIFTRRGGISPAPWGSLNAGSRVGDTRANVAENIRRAVGTLGRPPESLTAIRQVHKAGVHRVNASLGQSSLACLADPARDPEKDPLIEADAMITDNPGVTLFMRYADCVPVLLYDPVRRAAGMAHAGWRGTVGQIAVHAVERMAADFGSRPGDILAGIGPAICAEHYEVGSEVAGAFEESFRALGTSALLRAGRKPHLDLVAANHLLLQSAGVVEIEVSGECTAGNTQRWYSHRAEGGATGRFMAMAGIGGHAY